MTVGHVEFVMGRWGVNQSASSSGNPVGNAESNVVGNPEGNAVGNSVGNPVGNGSSPWHLYDK